MDAAETEELRTLRARAFGPGADLHSDPAGLRRLAELEALRREKVRPSGAQAGGAERTEPGPIAPVPAVSSSAGHAPGHELEAEPEPELEPELKPGATTPTPARAVRRVLTNAAWAASIIVAAALAATITFALTGIPRISAETGARQVATLEPDPSVEWPPGWFGGDDDSIVGFEYLGLSLISTSTSLWTGETEGECLVAAHTAAIDADSDSINGPLFSDCRAGGFPATVEILVDRSAPAEIHDAFPEGSGLQFVLEGDRVGVFSDGG